MKLKKFFVSFEMIFGNGSDAMGNMCVQYSGINSDEDVVAIETMVRQKVNAGNLGRATHVEAVTLINWKVL